MDYWRECISEAFDDVGLTATQEQINGVAYWVESAHANYGEATGHNVASANLRAFHENEKEKLQQQLRYEQTVPRTRCKWCSGYGYTKDGWGREFGCGECDGKGSTPLYPFTFNQSK